MSTERVTLNSDQRAAILPGLEFMGNELRSGRRFPRSPDATPGSSTHFTLKVHRDRQFHPSMAEVMLTARNKLLQFHEQGKVRLNPWEIAALAFALRLLAKANPAALVPKLVLKELSRKLETYRKRAKRSVIRQSGSLAYLTQQKLWTEFLHWMRFFLVPTKRYPQNVHRRIQKEQFLRMYHLVLGIIFERTEGVVDLQEVRRAVRMLLRRFRRNRRGPTVLSIIENPEANHDYIFYELLLGRFDLGPIKRKYMRLCDRMSENHERFESAKVISPD